MYAYAVLLVAIWLDGMGRKNQTTVCSMDWKNVLIIRASMVPFESRYDELGKTKVEVSHAVATWYPTCLVCSIV